MMQLYTCVIRRVVTNSLCQFQRQKHVKTRNPFKKIKPLGIQLEQPEPPTNFPSADAHKHDFDEDEELVEDVLEHPEVYYDLHMEERRLERKKVRNAIIRRKYFKVQPETNLLTWAAKEQIHYLHNLDPTEWTAERIAECFPVSVQGAKKLLKSRFTVASPQRIAEHDRGVALKWKALKTGRGDEQVSPVTKQLYLDGKLCEDHAYGNKTLPVPQQGEHSKALELSDLSPKPGEYSKLIATYMNIKSPKKQPPSEKEARTSHRQEYDDVYMEDIASATTLAKAGRRGVHVQIDEYKAATRGHSGGGNLDVQTRAATDSSTPELSLPTDDKLEGENSALTFDSLDSSAGQYAENFDIVKASEHRRSDATPRQGSAAIANDEVMQRQIEIPSRFKSKNFALYRVGKCYYDNDGEILYKVP